MASAEKKDHKQREADSFSANFEELLQIIGKLIAYAEKQNVPLRIASSTTLALVKVFIGDSLSLAENFVAKTYEYWDKIKDKDKSFLISNIDKIFSSIPSDAISDVTTLMQVKNPGTKEYLFDSAMEADVWNYLQAMVVNCIKLVHYGREPCCNTKKYTVVYFPKIKLASLIKAWEVKA
jgi:hypothetical protein